jgi:hypothetical protein
MAFKINEKNETASWVEADEKLWLTADRERVVADGDPEAAFLFATPGKRVSREDAERYGLVKSAKAKGAAKAKAEAEAPAG